MATRKGTGKQKRVPKYSLTGARKSKTREANPFGMQMIANRIGDGWHKMSTREFAPEPFEPTRIDALFGYAFND